MRHGAYPSGVPFTRIECKRASETSRSERATCAFPSIFDRREGPQFYRETGAEATMYTLGVPRTPGAGWKRAGPTSPSPIAGPFRVQLGHCPAGRCGAHDSFPSASAMDLFKSLNSAVSVNGSTDQRI